MLDYFRGWKRKFGIMMLIVACVFAAAWVRSTIVQTSLSFQLGYATLHEICVSHGAVAWGRLFFRPGEFQQDVEFTNTPITDESTSIYEVIGEDTPWQFRLLGFGVCNRSDINGVDASTHGEPIGLAIVVIPVWSISVPLALISAWLLLSKRRKLSLTAPPPNPENNPELKKSSGI